MFAFLTLNFPWEHVPSTFPSLSHYSPATDCLEFALMTFSKCSGIVTVGDGCSLTASVIISGPFSGVCSERATPVFRCSVVFTGPLALLRFHHTHPWVLQVNRGERPAPTAPSIPAVAMCPLVTSTPQFLSAALQSSLRPLMSFPDKLSPVEI